jgi:hypothetical protein
MLVTTFLVFGCGGTTSQTDPAGSSEKTVATEDHGDQESDSVGTDLGDSSPESTSRASTFWNDPNGGQWEEVPFPACDGEFSLQNPIVDFDEAISLHFSPGWHIAPHDHMLYWLTGRLSDEDLGGKQGVQISRRVDIFAPTDIFYMSLMRWVWPADDGGTYSEWSAYFTTCGGHRLVFHHVDDPSTQVLQLLKDVMPDCASSTAEALVSDEYESCRWQLQAFIPAGEKLLQSSGYSAGFDFGLTLMGLTSEELQTQPGYGFALNPWQPTSGNAVCPLYYFPEPHRSEYLKKLNSDCGLFNQDVPGTAMGFWLSRPTPTKVPPSNDRVVDENTTMWLFRLDETEVHRLTIGSFLPGLPRGQYRFEIRREGIVNRAWNEVVPDLIYCSTLNRQINFSQFEEASIANFLVAVSTDGLSLVIEAQQPDGCAAENYSFSERAMTLYR